MDKDFLDYLKKFLEDNLDNKTGDLLNEILISEDVNGVSYQIKLQKAELFPTNFPDVNTKRGELFIKNYFTVVEQQVLPNGETQIDNFYSLSFDELDGENTGLNILNKKMKEGGLDQIINDYVVKIEGDVIPNTPSSVERDIVPNDISSIDTPTNVVDDVVELENSIRSKYSDYLEEDTIRGYKSSLENPFKADVPIYEKRGIQFNYFEGNPNKNFPYNKDTLYIKYLYIDETQRGQGIGSQIFDEIKKFADDNGLYIRLKNDQNFNTTFWEKKGFGIYEGDKSADYIIARLDDYVLAPEGETLPVTPNRLDTPTNVVDDNYIKGSSNGPSRTDKILIETLEDFASYSKIPFSEPIEILKQNQGLKMNKELGYTEDGLLYLYNSIDNTYEYVDPNNVKKLTLFLQENDLIDFLYTNQLYVPFQINADKEILTKEEILKLPDIPVNHITEGEGIIRNLKEKYPNELLDLDVDFDNVDGGRINIQSLYIDSDIKEKEIYENVINELNELSNKYNISINNYDDNPIHNFYNIIDTPTNVVGDEFVDNIVNANTQLVNDLPLSETVKNQFDNVVKNRAKNLATPGGVADAVDVWELGVLGLMIAAIAYKEYDEIPTIFKRTATNMFNSMTAPYNIPPVPLEQYDLDYEFIEKVITTGEKVMPTDIIIKKVGEIAKGVGEQGLATGFGYVPTTPKNTDTMETTQKIQPGVQEEKMFEKLRPKKTKSAGGSGARIQ